MMNLLQIRIAVENEYKRATHKHKPMNSHHEAYAVIKEEFEEYWREVQKGGSTCPRDPAALQLELIHTAAMCFRALGDLCGSLSTMQPMRLEDDERDEAISYPR